MCTCEGDNRLIGEEATPELMNDNIVMFFNLLAGRKYVDVKELPFIAHTKLRLAEMADGSVGVYVKHRGNEECISMTAAFGAYLTQIVSEIRNFNPSAQQVLTIIRTVDPIHNS